MSRLYTLTLDRLALAGPAREAGFRWLSGAPIRQVGEPLRLTHPQSVYKWANRVGLPARMRYPRSRRALGALSDVGRRADNAKNFRRSA